MTAKANPNKLIDTDLVFLVRLSSENAKWFVHFLDNYIETSKLYFHTSKDKELEAFQNYNILVEQGFHTTSHLRT